MITSTMLDRALDALILYRGEGDVLLVREILRASQPTEAVVPRSVIINNPDTDRMLRLYGWSD